MMFDEQKNHFVRENTEALRLAVKSGERKLAMDLLENSVYIDDLDPDKTSLLMMAAYRGYADVCQRLLDLGADPLYGFELYLSDFDEDVEPEWHCALDRAKMSRDAATIDVVDRAFVAAQWGRLKLGEKIDSYFAEARLEDAARLGMLDVCLDMIKHGVRIERVGHVTTSPATIAADHGQISTCVLLIALGATSKTLECCESLPEELFLALCIISKYVQPATACAYDVHRKSWCGCSLLPATRPRANS